MGGRAAPGVSGRPLAARRSSRWRLAVAAALVATLAAGGLGGAQTIPGALPESAQALARGEWPTYGGTYASAKYSPLDQITPANVAALRVAWRWSSPDQSLRRAHPAIDPSFLHESTPVMVNGTLYTSTSLSQVAAIDAATGLGSIRARRVRVPVFGKRVPRPTPVPPAPPGAFHACQRWAAQR